MLPNLNIKQSVGLDGVIGHIQLLSNSLIHDCFQLSTTAQRNRTKQIASWEQGCMAFCQFLQFFRTEKRLKLWVEPRGVVLKDDFLSLIPPNLNIKQRAGWYSAIGCIQLLLDCLIHESLLWTKHNSAKEAHQTNRIVRTRVPLPVSAIFQNWKQAQTLSWMKSCFRKKTSFSYTAKFKYSRELSLKMNVLTQSLRLFVLILKK